MGIGAQIVSLVKYLLINKFKIIFVELGSVSVTRHADRGTKQATKGEFSLPF